MDVAGSAEAIRGLREAAGLEIGVVADALDISYASAHDLEAYDDEATTCLSLRQLVGLCSLLTVDPVTLFSAADADSRPRADLSPHELSSRIQDHLRDTGLPLAEFEDQAGWELGAFLRDPSEIWEWNVDCLVDVCSAITIDWRQVLSSLHASVPPEKPKS